MASQDHRGDELEDHLHPCALEFIPRSAFYYKIIEGMNFKITYTLRAERVERWIRTVKRDFLDTAQTKIVGLDCEFTSPREITTKNPQRAAVLQLSVAYETLVFHIDWADRVPQGLIDFLADPSIKFCGAAIHNDVKMLQKHGINNIPSAMNLQNILRNPVPNKPTPSLVDLANYYIGTKLQPKKKKPKKGEVEPPKTAQELEEEEEEEEEALIHGWHDIPLSQNQLVYAALDARLGFELGRKAFERR